MQLAVPSRSATPDAERPLFPAIPLRQENSAPAFFPKTNIALAAPHFRGTIPLPRNPGRWFFPRAGHTWGRLDGWQSGRLRTPGKRVYRKVTGVRIPPHPPLSHFTG